MTANSSSLIYYWGASYVDVYSRISSSGIKLVDTIDYNGLHPYVLARTLAKLPAHEDITSAEHLSNIKFTHLSLNYKFIENEVSQETLDTILHKTATKQVVILSWDAPTQLTITIYSKQLGKTIIRAIAEEPDRDLNFVNYSWEEICTEVSRIFAEESFQLLASLPTVWIISGGLLRQINRSYVDFLKNLIQRNLKIFPQFNLFFVDKQKLLPLEALQNAWQDGFIEQNFLNLFERIELTLVNLKEPPLPKKGNYRKLLLNQLSGGQLELLINDTLTTKVEEPAYIVDYPEFHIAPGLVWINMLGADISKNKVDLTMKVKPLLAKITSYWPQQLKINFYEEDEKLQGIAHGLFNLPYIELSDKVKPLNLMRWVIIDDVDQISELPDDLHETVVILAVKIHKHALLDLLKKSPASLGLPQRISEELVPMISAVIQEENFDAEPHTFELIGDSEHLILRNADHGWLYLDAFRQILTIFFKSSSAKFEISLKQSVLQKLEPGRLALIIEQPRVYQLGKIRKIENGYVEINTLLDDRLLHYPQENVSVII